MVAVLTVAAAAGFHRVFAGTRFLGALAACAVLAVAVSAWAGWRRMSWAGSALFSVLAYGLVTSYLVLDDTMPNLLPRVSTFRELAGGLTGGWADLLTVSLPTSGSGRPLVAACAAVWAAAALGAEMLFRNRSVIAPVLPPLVCYGLTLVYGASAPSSSTALPLGIAGLSLLTVLLQANRWALIEPAGLKLVLPASTVEATSEPTLGRNIGAGVGVIGASLLIGSLLAGTLPKVIERKAFDVRNVRRQREVEAAAVSPLASLRDSLRQDPPTRLFTIQIERSEAERPDRIRLAVLDRYDGAEWTGVGRYSKVGSVLPDAVTSRPTEVVRQRIVIDGLRSPWLPAMDRPARLDTGPTESVRFDAGLGTLQSSDPLASGTSYVVTSLMPRFDKLDLTKLAPPAGRELAAQRALPANLPGEIADLARRISGETSSPYQKLEVIEAWLRANRGYSEQVLAGNSVGRLNSFLFGTKIGYAEQFAGAFALMSRTLGIPSRLVVGFDLIAERGAHPLDDGVTLEVTSRAFHVWPEAYLDGAGWVPFEPTPARVDTPAPKEDRVVDAPTRAVEILNGGVEGPAIRGDKRAHQPALSTRWSVLIGLTLALMTALLALPLAKFVLRRRRYRLALTPADKILGAWRSMVDRLLEVGVPVERSMTARQVAARCDGVVPEDVLPHMFTIAPIVAATLFAAEQPPDDLVDEVEELAADFGKRVVSAQPLIRRVAAWFSPKPLVYNWRS